MSTNSQHEPKPSLEPEHSDSIYCENGIIDAKLSFGQKIKYAGQVMILGAVISPLNEAARLPVAIATQLETHNSVAAGIALSAATFLIEKAGAWSTADLIDSKYGGKVFEWLHEKTEKVLKGRKMSAPVEALVGYGGGAAVVMAAKQAEDPTRTLEENQRHGTVTSGWLAGVVGLQWMSGGNAIQNPTPVNVGLALASTVGAYAGVKFAQSHSNTKYNLLEYKSSKYEES